MALSFTRAQTVAVDQQPTSTHARSLARAFNDRLRSGVGDGARRVAWYMFNLFRLVRNCDSTGLVFPAQDEYFRIYQALDPDHTTYTWPVADPGEAEGANLACHIQAYVHGTPWLYSEADRLCDPDFPLTIYGKTPETTGDFWQLGKLQRGAYDPRTGAQTWPEGDAAQAFFQIQTSIWNPHGKSWGGFLPMPETLLSDCGTTAETGLGIPSLEIKFTGTSADVEIPTHHGTLSYSAGIPIITYDGSCPCGTTEAAVGHVAWIWEGLSNTYVATLADASECSVNIDTLPLADWLQGPYTGTGHLGHTDGQQLRRALAAFVGDFRGTEAQRTPDTFDIRSLAPDVQTIFSRQWPLAPARGRQIGADTIRPVYPKATLTAGQTSARWDTGSVNYAATPEGFLVSGFYAHAEHLEGEASLEVKVAGARKLTLRLTPDENGEAEAVGWLSTATRATKDNPVTVTTAAAPAFATGGKITVEAAELVEYLPESHDLALFLRIGAAGNDQQVDGRGPDTSNAASIGANLLKYGCIAGQAPEDHSPATNRNPVYDAARRLSKRILRIIPRQNFVAYEVDSEGRSVLYLKRFAAGLADDRVDLLDGIAPPLDPAEAPLDIGETYVVRAPDGGTVKWNRKTFSDEQTFTVTADGGQGFTATGEAALYVWSGVRPKARRNGWSNSWLAFMEWKRYHPSATSTWKPDAYADFFPFCERCHFYSGTATAALRRQIAYGYEVTVDGETGAIGLYNPRIQSTLIAPESMTGFRYALGSNNSGYEPNPTEFRKSCRVYEPPTMIESVTVDDWSEDQIVKVTFSSRFHAHESAPSTWSRTAPTWGSEESQPAEVTALDAEDYRTDDNAWRQYHVHIANATYHPAPKTGDAGQASSVDSLPDNPFAAIYPSLFLVAEIPEPWLDGNDTVETTDSRMTAEQWQSAELYLRAMSEGYVDTRSSETLSCQEGAGNLIDYTFENLCFDAFGGRWISPTSTTHRSDKPQGFGPLVNTKPYSEMWNQMAAAVNLLTRARLDLPVEFESRTVKYSGSADAPAGIVPDPDGCSETGEMKAWRDKVSPGAANTVTLDTGWAVDNGEGLVARHDSWLAGCPFRKDTTRQTCQWRARVETDWEDALPPDLKSFVQNTGLGIVGDVRRITYTYTRSIVGSSPESQPCGDVSTCYPFFDGTNYHLFTEVETDVTTCTIDPPGFLVTGTPPVGDYWIGHCSGETGGICSGGSGSYIDLTPYDIQMPFLDVPLVDLEEEEASP